MRKLCYILIFSIISISYCFTEDFRGADISWFSEIESKGGKYKISGKEESLFSVLEKAGVNWIRLRLWVNPDKEWCNLENTVKIAKRVKQAGFKLLLDIHYSDSWADPAYQTVPAKWKNLTFNQLEKEINLYTKNVLDSFQWESCIPDMVQIGNEITNGFVWPYGEIKNGNTKKLMTLLSACSSAVREAAPEAKILVHLDRGGDNQTAVWWFSEAEKYTLDYDVIGLSYYSFFHGTELSVVGKNVQNLNKKFKKEVVIVETSYPWTFGWKDNTHNQVGEGSALVQGFNASPEGQNKYLNTLYEVVKANGGTGVFYWEPDAICAEGFENPLENQSWFDFDGNWNGTGFQK